MPMVGVCVLAWCGGEVLSCSVVVGVGLRCDVLGGAVGGVCRCVQCVEWGTAAVCRHWRCSWRYLSLRAVCGVGYLCGSSSLEVFLRALS